MILFDKILLWLESPSGICAKLHIVAANNNRDHLRRSRSSYTSHHVNIGRASMPYSLYYCLFAPHIWVLFFAHIQCNANWEVATTCLPFNNELHQLHVLFVKASHSTTFTSWSHWQQTTIEITWQDHSPRMLVIMFNHSPAKIGWASTPLSLYFACLCHI